MKSRKPTLTCVGVAALVLSSASVVPGQRPPPRDVEHVIVFREPGRYAGWPANHGIWAWGNEIVVGFSAGHMDPATKEGPPRRHPIDRSRPEEHLLACTTTTTIQGQSVTLRPQSGTGTCRSDSQPCHTSLVTLALSHWG